jgi:hypothetical protein
LVAPFSYCASTGRSPEPAHGIEHHKPLVPRIPELIDQDGGERHGGDLARDRFVNLEVTDVAGQHKLASQRQKAY